MDKKQIAQVKKYYVKLNELGRKLKPNEEGFYERVSDKRINQLHKFLIGLREQHFEAFFSEKKVSLGKKPKIYKDYLEEAIKKTEKLQFSEEYKFFLVMFFNYLPNFLHRQIFLVHEMKVSKPERSEKFEKTLKKIANFFGYIPKDLTVEHIAKITVPEIPAPGEPKYMARIHTFLDAKALDEKTISGTIPNKSVEVHELLHIYNFKICKEMMQRKLSIYDLGSRLGLKKEEIDYIIRLSNKFKQQEITEGFAQFSCKLILSKINYWISRVIDIPFNKEWKEGRKHYLKGYHLMRRLIYPKYGKAGILISAVSLALRK